jgi:hypothetical protein
MPDRPLGERVASVETELSGIKEDVHKVLQILQDPNPDHDMLVRMDGRVTDLEHHNAGQVLGRSNMRSLVLAVAIIFLALPSSISASVAVYHLAVPAHTIVQNAKQIGKDSR